MTPTAQEAPRPLFRRKRVLIPAGLFSLVLVLAFLTSTGETRDTLETDRTRELTEAEAVAVTTVSTTTPTTTSTTTTTPIAAALVDSDFTSVDVAELTEAREQLAAAAIVAEFEGFSDYDRDTTTVAGGRTRTGTANQIATRSSSKNRSSRRCSMLKVVG